MLSGKYKPGQPHPEGSRATDEKGGASAISRFLSDDVLTRVQELAPIAQELVADAWRSSPSRGYCRTRTSRRRSSAPRAPSRSRENVAAAGVKIPAELMARIDDVLGEVVVRDPRRTDESSPKERVA